MDHRASAALDWVRERVADGRLPFAVIGIADVDGAEVLEGVGAAVDDRFALFSVTKPLVALAAARAIERGVLTPRTPLAAALPGFGAGFDGVVVLEHLLSHTAGLEEPALDAPGPLRDLLRQAGQVVRPGAAVRYSSLAYEGVAALLEHATGEDLEQQLVGHGGLAPGAALGFDPAGARPVVGADRTGFDLAALTANRHPGAGLHGTARDLLELGRRLLLTARGERGPLHPLTLRTMLRDRTSHLPWAVREPERRDFGLGWQLRTRSAGLIDRSAFGHGGWSGAQWWIAPEAGRVVVLLTGVADFAATGIDVDELVNAATVGS